MKLTEEQKKRSDGLCDICLQREANMRDLPNGNREVGFNMLVMCGDTNESVYVQWCDECWAKFEEGDREIVSEFDGIAECAAMEIAEYLRRSRELAFEDRLVESGDASHSDSSQG